MGRFAHVAELADALL